MPTNTTDQGIPLPVDGDVADNPVAFANFVAVVEPRLVRLYTDAADRTTRQLVVAENELSGLATENRVEVHNGTTNVSLLTRSFYAMVRKTADQVLTASSTTLQDVSGLVVAMTTGVSGAIYPFEAELFYDAATAADIKFAFTIPTGATMRWGLIAAATGGGASGDGTFATATASASAIAAGGAGVATFLNARIWGELTMSTNAGNFQLQAAQNTSDASVTTVAARSRLSMWRLS